MPALGRPPDGVARATRERAKQAEVTFRPVMRIEGHVSFDRDTGSGATQVRVVARYESESVSLGLPGEVDDGV